MKESHIRVVFLTFIVILGSTTPVKSFEFFDLRARAEDLIGQIIEKFGFLDSIQKDHCSLVFQVGGDNLGISASGVDLDGKSNFDYTFANFEDMGGDVEVALSFGAKFSVANYTVYGPLFTGQGSFEFVVKDVGLKLRTSFQLSTSPSVSEFKITPSLGSIKFNLTGPFENVELCKIIGDFLSELIPAFIDNNPDGVGVALTPGIQNVVNYVLEKILSISSILGDVKLDSIVDVIISEIANFFNPSNLRNIFDFVFEHIIGKFEKMVESLLPPKLCEESKTTTTSIIDYTARLPSPSN